MARNQTVIPILQNVLALNRVKKECYYQPIRVDFSPIEKPNNTFQEIIPYFNHDHNHYTPAFILPKDKLSQNLILQKNKFEARITHSENKQEQQNPQFKPTDNEYCQLCQQYFSDYWEHINCKYHKRMINSSKFNKDIIKLTQKFTVSNQIKMPLKDKKISKSKSKNNMKNIKNKVHCKKQESIKIEKNQLKTYKLENNGLFNTFQTDIKKNQRKNVDQSLKINLQLGNFSTNLASTNLM